MSEAAGAAEVAAALGRLDIPATAAEAASVAEELRRIDAALAGLARRWGEAPPSPPFAALLARREAGPPRMDQDGDRDRLPFDPAGLRRVQDATNAFAEIFSDRLDGAGRRDGPLGGLAFAYKDAFAAPGRLPSCGVGQGYRWQGPPSTLLAALREHGATAVGATNLDPHCYTPVGFSRDFGRVLNPRGPAYAVGGSSSGSAAAVAAGAVPLALGSDTGGSVRIPASLCGVYGLKPTHGRLADPGLAPLSPSQDTPGLIARDLALLGRVFGLLAGRGPDDRGKRGGPPRIGVDLGFCDGLDEDVADCFQRALQRARDLGADVVDVVLPPVEDLNLLAMVVTGFEAAGLHRAGLARQPQHYPAAVRRRLLTALMIRPEDHALALRLRPMLLRYVLDTAFVRADVIACPTLRIAAPHVDGLSHDDPALGRLGLEFLRLNRPINYLGLPALSLPMGRDAGAIPTGLQLVGRPNAEEDLIALAAALQRQDP